MLAAERGNEEAAATLIEGGANIYLEDEDLGPFTGAVAYNRTALDYAVAGGNRRIMTMIAERWKGRPLTRRGNKISLWPGKICIKARTLPGAPHLMRTESGSPGLYSTDSLQERKTQYRRSDFGAAGERSDVTRTNI